MWSKIKRWFEHEQRPDLKSGKEHYYNIASQFEHRKHVHQPFYDEDGNVSELKMDQ